MHAGCEVGLDAEGMVILGVAVVHRDIVEIGGLEWAPATGCFKGVVIDPGFGKRQVLIPVGEHLIVVGKSE